ncbi:outer membrane beta-barrel protein [Hymenobacter humi]|uniref:Outer membrane beta-barrel protein n=1 Tax=Hymenobacter humi TaxID=1411620 RepID=A0ABW2UC24_9BACT
MNLFAIFLLAALALLSAATASAQAKFHLGLRGGGNWATTTLDNASNGSYSGFSHSADKSAMYAWQAGAVLEVAFNKFALQPALLFSQKGERFHTSGYINGFVGTSGFDTESTNRYNWLEMPLNAVYTVRGFQVFAGPYLAVAVGGRQKGTTTRFSPFVRSAPENFTQEIEYGSQSTNRRVDAGVNMGIGYRRGATQVQLGYGLGLRNLHQINPYQTYDLAHDFPADAAYNRVVQLTGTYFFGL